MEQLQDLHTQIGDPEVDQEEAWEVLATEMAWVVLHEGETPSRIAHMLGLPQETVEHMIESVDEDDEALQ